MHAALAPAKGCRGYMGDRGNRRRCDLTKFFLQFLQNHKVLNINTLISLQGESHVACSVMIADLLHYINL